MGIGKPPVQHHRPAVLCLLFPLGLNLGDEAVLFALYLFLLLLRVNHVTSRDLLNVASVFNI